MKLELLQHEELGIKRFLRKLFFILLHFSFRLLSFLWELSQLLLSLATIVAMADLMEGMVAMADPMVDMEAMAMARERPRLLLMLSLVIEAMDTAATADLMEAMVDMAMASEYLLTQTCFFKFNFAFHVTIESCFTSKFLNKSF